MLWKLSLKKKEEIQYKTKYLNYPQGSDPAGTLPSRPGTHPAEIWVQHEDDDGQWLPPGGYQVDFYHPPKNLHLCHSGEVELHCWCGREATIYTTGESRHPQVATGTPTVKIFAYKFKFILGFEITHSTPRVALAWRRYYKQYVLFK